MFALGHVWIGDYKVWITTPVFSLSPLDSKARDLPYFEVMVTRSDGLLNYYVNLMDDDKFRFLFDVNEKKQPTDKTDMVVYNSYLNNKSMQMPLWRLSKSQIDMLLRSLLSMSYECT